MHYYEPDTYYQQRSRLLGAGDGCYSPDGIQVYTISETAYAELCRNIWKDDFIRDAAPTGEYVLVCGRMWFGGKYYVTPMNAFSRLLYACEELVEMYDYARRYVRRHVGVEFEVWQIIPDDELDTVSPVVFATDPDTGKQLVITPDAEHACTQDALDVAMIAINQGYDNVGIAWMRSDWAVSQLLASCHLYMLGYSLCNAIPDRLGVVINGRD